MAPEAPGSGPDAMLQASELDFSDRAIGLHPIAMLALTIMAKEPSKAFTWADIQHELNDAQGAEPAWRAESMRSSYLRDLVRTGLVFATRMRARGKDVFAIGITEEYGQEVGVPICGSLLDLELTTDFSSQQVFGSSNSVASDQDDRDRAPLVRLQVLRQLKDRMGGVVNMSDLYESIPHSTSLVGLAVRELASVDVLRVLHKANPADRQLALSEPNQATINRYRPSMSPVNQALHDTLLAMYRRGVRRLDGATLVNEVMLHSPDLDAALIWDRVVRVTPHFLSFVDANLFGSNKGKNAPRTRVEIAKPYIALVTDLLQRIEGVRHSGVYREAATEQALHITNTPAAVAYLLAKARTNSKFAQGTQERYVQQMTRLRRRLVGWVGLKDLFGLGTEGGPEGRRMFDSSWRDSAACRTVDSEIFFPRIGENFSKREAAAPRKVCNRCPVRLSCLQWAVNKNEEHGMWGGLTPKERRELSPAALSLLRTVKVR